MSQMIKRSFRELVSNTQATSKTDAGDPPPRQAGGRWKTAEAYAMRRIVTLRDPSGKPIGYRPMIQQGRGDTRMTHSEVFRITADVSDSLAMGMAQRWRDAKEHELGISSGQLSSKSASRFVPGISLIVSSKPPYRSCWKWAQSGEATITKYISKKLGYFGAYAELVKRICDQLCLEVPADLAAPTPNPVQYAILLAQGIPELPDRRKAPRA